MAEMNYPGNSDRAQNQNAPAPQQTGRPSEKHVSRVTTGGVQTKSRGAWDKISQFFGMDELHTFKDYISFAADITNRVYSAIDTLMGNRRGPSTVPGARVEYRSYYNNPVPQQNRGSAQQRVSAGYSYDDLIFNTRGDAEIVLEKMYELLRQYRAVSISDMFDLAGVSSPNGYTDNKYGWRDDDLQGARIIRVSNGYMIDLPRAGQL